jgi:hypothetical protein
MSGTQFQGYIDKLKKLKNILTAYEIDANNLKAKELDLFV